MNNYETERLPDEQEWSDPKRPPSSEWFLDQVTGAEITGPVPWKRGLPRADTEDVVSVVESPIEPRDSEIWDEPDWKPEPVRLDTMAILKNELHSFLDESRVGEAVQRLMAFTAGELAGMLAKVVLFAAVVAVGAFGVSRGVAAMTNRKPAAPTVTKVTRIEAQKAPMSIPATPPNTASDAPDDLLEAGVTASADEPPLETEPVEKVSARAAKKGKKSKRIKRGKSGKYNKYKMTRASKKKHKSRKRRRARRRT